MDSRVFRDLLDIPIVQQRLNLFEREQVCLL